MNTILLNNLNEKSIKNTIDNFNLFQLINMYKTNKKIPLFILEIILQYLIQEYKYIKFNNLTYDIINNKLSFNYNNKIYNFNYNYFIKSNNRFYNYFYNNNKYIVIQYCGFNDDTCNYNYSSYSQTSFIIFKIEDLINNNNINFYKYNYGYYKRISFYLDNCDNIIFTPKDNEYIPSNNLNINNILNKNESNNYFKITICFMVGLYLMISCYK